MITTITVQGIYSKVGLPKSAWIIYGEEIIRNKRENKQPNVDLLLLPCLISTHGVILGRQIQKLTLQMAVIGICHLGV